MAVSFSKIRKGEFWTRDRLAKLWGYESRQAIARGLITPRGQNLLVFFITQEKERSETPYRDCLEGNHLEIDGERAHRTDDRIVKANDVGDEMHLFYRERHHQPFEYHGRLRLIDHKLHRDRPSRFKFQLIDQKIRR